MSQAAIGAALNRSQTWVADIVRGRYRDIPWSEGEALRQLHRKMTDGRRRQPEGGKRSRMRSSSAPTPQDPAHA